jgi:hypothetical protein
MVQQVGVLLAYAELNSDMGHDYRTMWIIFSPAEHVYSPQFQT